MSLTAENQDGDLQPRHQQWSDEAVWRGELLVSIGDPQTENATASSSQNPQTQTSLASQRSSYVTYLVRAATDLPNFRQKQMQTRKRFRDFEFLHDALQKEFPVCIIPPLPEKRRIGYLVGDRFSKAFLQKRVGELQWFMERIARHPTLQRAKIVEQFLESKEWHIDMHTHRGQPAGTMVDEALVSSASSNLLEQLSDSMLNAFTKVRKPDPRFLAISAELALEQERIAQLRRILLRNRTHVSAYEQDHLCMREVAAFDELYATSLGASNEDLATDWEDWAISLNELANLETGMASDLLHSAQASHDVGQQQAQFTSQCTDTILSRLQSQSTHTHSHSNPLKLRESKQLDFEGLTDYLAHEIDERDRLLALGHASSQGGGQGNIRGTGVRGYLRSTIDKVLRVDEEQARIERIQRMDHRITELKDAVNAAHDQALRLNEHVALEHHIYTLGRRKESHALLEAYTDGHIAMYQAQMATWDHLLNQLQHPSTSA
ncbi:intercellular trafficking and secretion [Malassezia yamatoensis]|uniref:Sorting nexin-4 n=1 Tax=Malassezia yamatoensis TaxID=253288 RepID=A0AAJ5YYV8_9BASI|nr:intercellular trafficking and secretion [Malassezia yamatoensis]